MQSLSFLALEIYGKLNTHYKNLNERREATKQYILTEVTQWPVKVLKQGVHYFFKPEGFEGTEDSSPFTVRLIYDSGFKAYELKYGNLNASSNEEMFKWDNKDPYRLQKALFLRTVLNNYILPMLLNGDIKAIMFSPYEEDGLKSERLSYFRNMFDKVGKDKLQWKEMGGLYFIYRKES